MEDIIIIGAGGFGREVQWLIERINEVSSTWNIIGYIDDAKEAGTIVDGRPVLGRLDYLIQTQASLHVVCAIGSSKTRKNVIDKVAVNTWLKFPNLVDPSVLFSERIIFGKGNIICAGSILTLDIILEDFVVVSVGCTIGHDARIGSFVTLYPNVNVSGAVFLGDEVELGVGCQVLQGRSILKESIIGAGAVVVKDIKQKGVYVGIPAVMRS